jgi:hypothetical protein
MMIWLKRVALALIGRLLSRDLEAAETTSALEAERAAANEAPTTREETAARLGRDGF